jgi:molybdenum cofactor cytidylyltransferase
MTLPPEPAGRVAGVVLAAGASSRLGHNKLLLDIGGEPVVHRAARGALDAGLSPVIVVLGHEADRVAAALSGLDLECAVNLDYSRGMHTSLQAGIRRVPADCDAAVVILADMPLVTAGMSAALVARFRAGPEPIVASRYGEEQAPPTLYARALFPALLAAGEAGGRRVIRDHPDRTAVVPWPVHLLADLDRAEDVERVRSMVAG